MKWQLVVLAIASGSSISSPCNAGRVSELEQLEYPGLALGDWFGNSAASDGGLTVVGAGGDDGRATEAAYVFDAATGHRLATLKPSDPTPQNSFARQSVGIDQGIVVVNGAQDYYGLGGVPGSAYLFDAASGAEIAKLSVPGTPQENSFGGSVAIDSGVAIVGTGGGGAAYLYEGSTGNPLRTLVPTGLPDGYSFGDTVAIDDGVAIVGASRYLGGGAWERQTYFFEVATGSQLGSLPTGGLLAAEDGLLIIGKGDASIVGSAEVYDIATRNPLLTLLGEGVQPGDRFGYSVAIDATLATVGAYEDGEAGARSGAAYVFDVRTGQQIAKLTGSEQGDSFGTSVATSGGFVTVGARFGSGATGAATTFAVIPEPATTTLVFGACLVCLPNERNRRWSRAGATGVLPIKVTC